jgi:hypothetical protein
MSHLTQRILTHLSNPVSASDLTLKYLAKVPFTREIIWSIKEKC